jgi:hypothetical protein
VTDEEEGLSSRAREPGEYRGVEMSGSTHSIPLTLLRESYRRARSLGLAEQVRECADQLGSPQLIAAEVLDAFTTIDSCFDPDDLRPQMRAEASPVERDESSEGLYYATREIVVVGEPCSFTCLASSVDPLVGIGRAGETEPEGLDYVGLSCDSTATPVLGAVQSERDSSAYPLLLRLLACLAEMAPPAQVQRLNRDVFKGVLGDRPVFDLNIVLREGVEEPDRTCLCQLTRDLSEKLKATIRENGRFPQILRDIVCLRINPARFQGRMCFEWRV